MRLLFKVTNRYSVANCLKVHVTRLFLSFPAFCCVHFLTFVSNSSIFQRPSTHALSFRRFRACDTICGGRFRCIFVVPCIWVQS